MHSLQTFRYLLLSFACIAAFHFSAASAKESSSQSQGVMDFTQVAKEAIPAVVSITVKETKQQTTTQNPWGSDDDQNNPYGNNDLFKHFFNTPRNGHETQQTPVIGQASGFIVSSDGHILTNSHVVKDATEISVVLNDGREFKGKLIGQDSNTDIAVVQIDAKDLPFLTLGNSGNMQIGQWVVAIGNPLGLQASLTVGVISATGRNNLDLARVEDFIQTDAAINRGNSGGPLLNLQGEVIGMNTAIVSSTGTGGYMGIGFAIPSNMLKHVMDELVTKGSVTRGFLGVILQQMDHNLAKAFKLDRVEGALVADVTKGSPAEKSGLKQGDVVLKYDDQTVTNIATLRNAVALMTPGATVKLTILRDGKTSIIPISIGTFPKDNELKNTAEVKENKYGFSVQELSPELAKTLGLTSEDNGVLITKVNVGSPASWAGLKKGALIMSVNQTKISSVDEFNKELDATEKGKPVLLLIKQEGQMRYISLLVS